MTTWTAGTRVFSAASSVEAIIVTGADVELACAGAPMLTERPEGVEGNGDGAELAVGKRFEDAQTSLVVMVTRPGAGPLTADGRELGQRAATPLPSSD
ncbi:hypothetical protein ACTU6U_07105 [Microbacterium sp. A196]|uniref:hypothetical protein n=1 Tax=unclassified Microbacterium TaxID=2609290 RepID=UPI003F2B6B9C